MRSLACSMVMAQRQPSPSRSRRVFSSRSPRLADVGRAKLDVEGVGLEEVGNLHGMEVVREFQ